jgi:hypothetical protein
MSAVKETVSHQICFGMLSFERLLAASANINNPGGLRIQSNDIGLSDSPVSLFDILEIVDF